MLHGVWQHRRLLGKAGMTAVTPHAPCIVYVRVGGELHCGASADFAPMGLFVICEPCLRLGENDLPIVVHNDGVPAALDPQNARRPAEPGGNALWGFTRHHQIVAGLHQQGRGGDAGELCVDGFHERDDLQDAV